MKTTFVTSTALPALLAGAAPLALAQSQPAAPAQAQPGQATQGAYTRADTQGRPAVPASDVEYSQAMERLFQAAQRLRESVQAMAQQPAGERRNQAIAQAREALLSTHQAMVQLPPDLRTSQHYREAERHVGEAGRALEGQQANPEKARTAVDAFLGVMPRMQADAAAAGRSATASATGAPAAGAAGAAGGGAAASVPLQRVAKLVGTDLIGPKGETVARSRTC